MAKYHVKRELTTKQEKLVTEQEVVSVKSSTKEGMRYVHLNPRVFKGRLGYAYVFLL
jgi:hypothetical protein